MKTIRELQRIDLKLSSPDLYFCYLKNLPDMKLDMDVFLPTKNMNLQRKEVWNLNQKQELIKSIIFERYIPPICVLSIINPDDINGNDIKQIIDGKQRLTAMIDFYQNRFQIELENQLYYYNDLPKDYQSFIGHYTIKCLTAYEDYDVKITDAQKIDWFNRINFAGTPQDIKHMNKLKS